MKRLPDEDMQQLLNLIEFTISISTKLQRTRSAREVQMLLKEEFARSSYVMVVFGLSDDGSKISVREVDAKFEKLRSIPGMRLEGLEFGVEHVKDYMAHIMSGETVQFSFRSAAELVLPPRLSRAVCSEVVEGMGLEVGTISPIRVRGRVAGIFYMATPRLSEFLTIPIKSLSEHISNALERIELESERKEAEDALRESETRFRTAFDKAATGMVIVSLDGTFLKANAAFCRMLGYSKGEMVGKRVVDVTHPDDIAISLRILKRQGRPNARAQTFEKRYLKKNGETVWGYSISNTVKGSGGRAMYFLAQIIDITDRKKLEEENRLHSEHLEALVEERTKKLKEIERLAAIGETTTWVGHDLRNPLQSIVNTVYLMRDTINRCTLAGDRDFMLGSLERLDRNVRYMDGIVSNLNEYARPTPPKRSPVRMQSLISEALDRTAIPREVSVRKDLAPVTAEVDRAMILRALVNVLTNAVQAMPDGGVLSVSCAPYAGGAKIEVGDTGHGIDPADMDKLFKLFFTKKAKGMGMGLPVTKKFVEMHEGTLDIRSELGKGTKVTIWLPMKGPQKTEAGQFQRVTV